MAASAATAGELGMSGNREHWDGPGGPDQQDPRDATLDLSRLIGILRPGGDDGGTASAGVPTRTLRWPSPAPLQWLPPARRHFAPPPASHHRPMAGPPSPALISPGLTRPALRAPRLP